MIETSKIGSLVNYRKEYLQIAADIAKDISSG
jgi:hypothetical protein